MSHPRLIKTLTQYRLHDSLVNWFREFLNNRTQIVLVNNTLSNALTVFSGVPQGGLIDPLLFIVYSNDISTETIHNDINLFADDPKKSGKSNDVLQLFLNNIYQRLKARKLKLILINV